MKATETAIRAILKRWRPRLGIDNRWSIAVKLHAGKDTWPKSAKGATAFVQVEPGYFQATLNFNQAAIDRDGDSLEYIVLHELAHIVVEPLAVVARDALGDVSDDTATNMVESVVETFTRALLAATKR